MKDILNKYPLNILRKSLIIVRTTYRLQKKEIINVLKTMKSINKLTKNEVIDLLISHNFDIKNLPELSITSKTKQTKQASPKAYEVATENIKEEIKKELSKLREEAKQREAKDELSIIREKAKQRLENFLKNNLIEYNIFESLNKEQKQSILGTYEVFKPEVATEIIKKKLKEYAEQKKPIQKQKEESPPVPELISNPRFKISQDKFLSLRSSLNKYSGDTKIKILREIIKDKIPLDTIFNILQFNKKDIQLLNAFFTPNDISDKLIKLSGIENDKRDNIKIFEPTAGIGNIIRRLLKLKNKNNFNIIANEYKPDFVELGKAIFYEQNNVEFKQGNILFVDDYDKFDYIFINPPFNMKFNNKIYNDYDFIAKVYNENLKEGGTIACILSSSYLSNKKYNNFKKKVELLNPYVEEIKTGFSSGEGVIKDMETKINMIYLIFQKKNSNIIL